MKRIQYLLLVLLCFVGACNTTKESDVNKASSEQVDLFEAVGLSNELVTQFLQSYIHVDEKEAEAKLLEYVNLCEHIQNVQIEETDVSNDPAVWYTNNRKHVDSVMNEATVLVANYEYEALFNLLIQEKGNIYSHPNSTSYAVFDLHYILSALGVYYMDGQQYQSEMVSNWELSRMQIETVQQGWDEYHSYYAATLEMLQTLYKEMGNTEKLEEVERLLKTI